MKKFIGVLATGVVLTGLLSACGAKEEAVEKPKKVEAAAAAATNSEEGEKATPEEVAQMERMDKGILLYGESNKGGDYLSTVENAGYKVQKEGKDMVGIINARVSIQNVRDDKQTVDLSEIDFSVKDEKTGKSYDGQPIVFDEDKFKKVPAGYSLAFDITFLVKNPPKNVDDFYLYMDSAVDPYSDIHWKLDKLTN
jgi:hypothetical protein